MFQTRFDELDSLIKTSEEIFRSHDSSMDQVDEIPVWIQLKIIQACTLMLEGHYPQAMDLAERTIDDVGEAALFYRCSLLWAIGESSRRLGDTEKAYAMFSEAISLSEIAGGTLYSPCCTWALGRIQVVYGKPQPGAPVVRKRLKPVRER